jgi:pimeloyl-ACP methyl ester carboxylesterase
MQLSRYQYVERGFIKGIEWMRSRGPSPRGIVLAPPLIGGHAIQQLRLLRPLVRRHLDLFSYNYAGHGASTGSFSLQAAVNNSFAALDLVLGLNRKDRLPLYGIASCFAAMPMFQSVHQRGEPLSKIVLINALPNLRWEIMAMKFFIYWRQSRQWRPSLKSLKAAIRSYRDELLPNVYHKRHAFGILSRHRIQWPKIMKDLITFRKLDAKPLRSTPVLCIYGRQDRFLKQIGFTHWGGYETLIESICPRARFLRVDGDHFLMGQDVRQGIMDSMRRFLVGAMDIA